jgi:hypothetical protein
MEGKEPMRVFRLSDGSSWSARLHDEVKPGTRRIGWEAVLFESSPHAAAQRLVYRPPGWLESASPGELAAALDEVVAVRVRWGDE